MKYISTALLLLMLITAGFSLVSCDKEDGAQKAEEVSAISNESTKDTSLEEEMEEIERQAEAAREMLIESMKRTGSDPSTVRGLNSNQVNLNATEDSGADEK